MLFEKNRKKAALAAFGGLFAAAMWFASVPVYAAGDGVQTVLDISKGSVRIGTDTVSGYDTEGNAVSVPDEDGYVIVGTTRTYNLIVSGGTHDLTLSNMSIDVSALTEVCAVSIEGGSVNFALSGQNTLAGGIGCAGLQVLEQAAVVIEGEGMLKATGGGAGIGSGAGRASGSITIQSGTVVATGQSGGAGIGSGALAHAGNITINGGIVVAAGMDDGAGIGGGKGAYCDRIEINGGMVSASSNNGAGIGSGAFDAAKDAQNGRIEINGGLISAVSAQNGAGIGGGANGAGGMVVISGGNVYAQGGSTAGTQDIGNGVHGTAGTLTDASGQAVYRNVICLEGITKETGIWSVDGAEQYGLKDVVTMDANKLYVYLPAECVPCEVITLDKKIYKGTINTERVGIFTQDGVLDALGYKLSGSVTSYGDSEEVACIQLWSGGTLAYETTAADGYYKFSNVPAGSYTLQVSKTGHVTSTYEITMDGQPAVCDVKLCIPGDLNGDGKVSMLDVSMLYAYVKGVGTLDAYAKLCADVVGDKPGVNVNDVSYLYTKIRTGV